MTDEQLLTQFVVSRDEHAFRQIVSRYASLVLGTITRTVVDRHLAEDAFQAVFIILARRASSIRWRASLAGWLHGVARRVALRTLQNRYLSREEPLAHDPPMETAPLDILGQRCEQQILDEELQRLPARWREPLILHELDGLSCEETAARLGLSLTALEGRLKRGRRELKHRLLRRGLGAGAILVAIGTSRMAGAATPDAQLIDAAVSAGLSPGSPTSATALPESAPHSLASQEILTMTTLKTTPLFSLAAVTVLGAGLLGSGWLLNRPAVAQGGAPGTIRLVAQAGETTPVENVAVDVTADVAGAEIPSGPFTASADPSPAQATTSQASATRVNDYRQSHPTEVRILRTLERPIEADFNNTELGEAITHVTEPFGIPVRIEEWALTGANVPLETPVTLTARDTSIAAVLNHLLRPLDLDYVIEDEMLVITSKRDADQRMETRVYDVMALEDQPEELARVIIRCIRPDSWGDHSWLEAYGPSPYAASPARSPRTTTSKPDAGDQDHASVETLPGRLIIRQSQRGHREIQDLLGQLQQVSQQQAEATGDQ